MDNDIPVKQNLHNDVFNALPDPVKNRTHPTILYQWDYYTAFISSQAFGVLGGVCGKIAGFVSSKLGASDIPVKHPHCALSLLNFSFH